MTYKESYMQCNTYEELEEQVKSDITYAFLINKDRIPIIERALNEVVKEKGWDCFIE